MNIFHRIHDSERMASIIRSANHVSLLKSIIDL